MIRSMFPRLGVVIVNWNRKMDTLRCIASVLSSDCDNFEVLVVDNASTDGSLEIIRETHPNLLTIYSSVNLGFTGGYNTGIQYFLNRGSDYLMLLNNDAVVGSTALSAFVTAALSHPEAGFLGAKICSLEDRQTILSAGGTLYRGWQPVHRGMGELDSAQFDALVEVEYLSGCALLVSRQAIESVGMLDNDFFAYHEDTEWCCRGKQGGFKVLFVPQARVWHPDTRKRDEESAPVTYYVARNSLLLARKRRLGTGALMGLMIGYARTLASWSLRPQWRHKCQQRDALALALRDFLRGRFGAMSPEAARVCYGS